MTEENYEKYKDSAYEIIAQLGSALYGKHRYQVGITERGDQSWPAISFRIKGLRWYFGIWAIGEWSESYEPELPGKPITIFGIHDWNMDKFRPSRADWRINIDLDTPSEFDQRVREFMKFLDMASKNPTQTWKNIEGWPKSYLQAWWKNEVSDPFKEWLEWSGSPLVLWGILRIIGFFDPYVANQRIVRDGGKSIWPRFIFGTLASKSAPPDQVYRVWLWYSEFPYKIEWITSKTKWLPGLFRAAWNVSDWTEDMSETDIDHKLQRGIYYEND